MSFAHFAEFHFLRPMWLFALVPLVLVLWFWARRRVSKSHWETAIQPELLAELLEPRAGGGSRALIAAASLALLTAIVGLAGPAWERLPQNVEQKSDALVVVFDLSLSMYAKDLNPSRLVRARQKITDLLRLREEGFTALVAYAGDAHIVAPLTDDTRTIGNLLAALRPNMMPVLGSRPETAIKLAEELLTNARLPRGRILLVTDGVDDINHVTRFCNEDRPISILGIGTPKGAPIPLDFVNQPGRVLETQLGDPVIARLDENRLGQIASLCHGRYHTLVLNDDDIQSLLATPVPGDEETTEVERDFDTWADAGYWTLIVLLPLALFAFRRGVFALLFIALVPLPRPAHADDGSFLSEAWASLWARPDQRAERLLREGEPARAATLFENPDWRAVAEYRSNNYAIAADAFARSGADYNLGNALARLKEYEVAIAAYNRALEVNPDHEDAAFNKALVEKLLEEKQQGDQQDSQEQQDQGGQDGENERSPTDGESGEQEQSPEQEQQADESQSGEDSQESEDGKDPAEGGEQLAQATADEETRDEKSEALEQWLRRVPDDPGGLLRRKFQYETNQRLRQGDYSNRQTEKIW